MTTTQSLEKIADKSNNSLPTAESRPIRSADNKIAAYEVLAEPAIKTARRNLWEAVAGFFGAGLTTASAFLHSVFWRSSADYTLRSGLNTDVNSPDVLKDASNVTVINLSTVSGNITLVIDSKIKRQMTSLGWNEQLLANTLLYSNSTKELRDTRWGIDGSRRDDPAIVFIDDDGHYLIRNELDNTIVQISDRKDPAFISPWV